MNLEMKVWDEIVKKILGDSQYKFPNIIEIGGTHQFQAE